MATTEIRPIYDFAGLEGYVTHGKGSAPEELLEQGEDRAVYRIASDTPEKLTRYVHALRAKYPRRKVEGYTIRMSFSDEDLDPNDPNSAETAAGLAVETVKELYPNSLYDVIIHDDGKGGKIHAHILVVNNDELTNKSIRGTSHKHVSLAADRVCARHGYHVLGQSASRTWQQTIENGNLTQFEQTLGEHVNFCLEHAHNVDEFKQLLDENGVELRETKNGWSYSMQDTTDPNKVRRRRRKASSLCSDFTRNEVERRFGEQVYTLSPELQEFEDKLHDEQDTRRKKTLSKPEAVTPRERNENSLTVDEFDTRMDACAIASCAAKNNRPNLYQEMRERIDKNGVDAFKDEMKQMQRETERAQRAFHKAKEQGRDVKGGTANIIDYAAQSTLKTATKNGSTSAIIVALLLAMWAERERQMQRMRQELARRNIYDKRAAMWTAEKREHAAQVVMHQVEQDALNTQDVKKDKQLKIEVAQQTPQTQPQASRGLQSAFSAPRQREHIPMTAPGGGASHDMSL